MKILILLIFVGCSHFSNPSIEYDARMTNFKYPFPVFNYSLLSQKQNLDMSYMDLKPEGFSQNTKVVLLLHGKNFSGFYWENIARDLVLKNYRVIIPDQIGFGKSSKPEFYQYSFAQLALNTKKLLSHIGVKKFTVVGHSMGGMLAVSMSYMFDSALDQLVLVNPIGLEMYLDHAQFKDTNFFYKRELGKTKQKLINYQKKNYYAGKWKAEYESLLEPTFGQLNSKDWPKVAWNNALTYAPIFAEDNIAKIKKLKVKTTLIIGTRDRTGPGRGWKKEGTKYLFGQYQNFARSFKRALPKSKVIQLKGLGHMPQFEDYKRFSKAFYPLF